MPKRSVIAGLLLALLAVAPRAFADGSAEDRAAADALYEQAGALMKAGRFSDACPKLETSQRLDPGIGTLIRLGYCYCNGKPEEGRGKTASAWAAFNEAEGMARKANDKRADEAGKQAKLLEPKLSKLLVDVAPENRAAGLEVRRDGKAVDAGVWGSALPVDPGSHTLEASQPGKQAWKTTFEVEAKPGVTTVRVPALANAPEGPRGAEVTEASAGTWGAQRLAGVSVAGAGVVGVAIGAALGGLAIGKNNASKAECLPSAPSMCSAEGAATRRSAGTLADASTGLFLAGGAALAAGAVVFFTAPASTSPKRAGLRRIEATPIAGLGTSGLLLRGEW